MYGVSGWVAVLHAIGWLFGVYPVPNGTPITYQFFSGSFLAVTIATGWWHKNNCHQKWCPRIGKHQVDGTPWCNAHHHEARRTYNGEVTNTEVS